MEDEMTNRQPAGTPVGGQFAEGRKPEGGDLAPDRNDVDLNEEVEENIEFSETHPTPPRSVDERLKAVDELQGEIDGLESSYRTDDESGDLDLSEHLDHYQEVYRLRGDVVWHQKQVIEELQAKVVELEKRTMGFSLNDAIRNDIFDQLSDDSVSEEQLRSEVAPVIDRYFDEFDPGDIKGLYDLRNDEVDYFFRWADENGYDLPRSE